MRKNERGIANIGIYFTVSAICMLITRPVIGKLADKFGIHKVLLPAFFMFGLFLLVVSFADSLPMFILAAVISACGLRRSKPDNSGTLHEERDARPARASPEPQATSVPTSAF